MAKKTTELDLMKFRNAVIGINKKIQLYVLSISIGGGGHDALRKELSKLNKLCKGVTNGEENQ